MKNWLEENNALTNTFLFADFVQAFAFMTEVAFLSEKVNHHPSWSNVYNEVTFSLQTHSMGNIVTEKDRELAKKISATYLKYSDN